MCGSATWLYVTLDSDITETLVSQRENVSPEPRVYFIECSEDYENYKRYPGEAFALTSLEHYEPGPEWNEVKLITTLKFELRFVKICDCPMPYPSTHKLNNTTDSDVSLQTQIE